MAATSPKELETLARDVQATVGQQRSRGWKKIAFAVVVVLVAVAAYFVTRPETTTVTWKTTPADRGDLILTATATGNLQPRSEVTVGAEVSGTVTDVLVSENDTVTKGQVLARFDMEQFDIALERANAQLTTANASVKEAQATLEEAKSKEKRKLQLLAKQSASKADAETATATRKRAAASLESARASARQARTQVSDAKSTIEKAVITSPIDGVVLQRSVEPGATVAASFQAPELFLLAEDLHEMELHVSLDEADVSLVHKDQTATFEVDAWPGRDFPASVRVVYLYPTNSNNVVTYTTVLEVDNSEELLRPGMTATATIQTGRKDNALRVPNTALRFTPPEQDDGGLKLFSPPGRQKKEEKRAANVVYVLRDGAPYGLPVGTGRTDGMYTEILEGDLQEGDEVLVGSKSAAKGERS